MIIYDIDQVFKKKCCLKWLYMFLYLQTNYVLILHALASNNIQRMWRNGYMRQLTSFSNTCTTTSSQNEHIANMHKVPFLSGLIWSTQRYVKGFSNRSPLVSSLSSLSDGPFCSLQNYPLDMPMHSSNAEGVRNFNSTLTSWGFDRKSIPGDGDCLFTSTATHIIQHLMSYPSSVGVNHLLNIGCLTFAPSCHWWTYQ